MVYTACHRVDYTGVFYFYVIYSKELCWLVMLLYFNKRMVFFVLYWIKKCRLVLAAPKKLSAQNANIDRLKIRQLTVLNCHKIIIEFDGSLQTSHKLITWAPIVPRLVLTKDSGFLISHSQINYIYNLICTSQPLPCFSAQDSTNYWCW